jgi:hypothetical protein
VILGFTPSTDLLSASRISRQFRQPALIVYFCRLGILHYYEPRPVIRLIGDLPVDSVRALCTSSIVEEFEFICDVAYLTSHMRQLRYFLTRVSKIPSVCIRFRSRSMKDPQTEIAISMAVTEFLVLVSNYDCRFMSVCNRVGARTGGEVNRRWFRDAQRACLANWNSAAAQMAAAKVNNLHLSTSFFSSYRLLQWCLSFSGNPSVVLLTLSNLHLHGPSYYHLFFPRITLPSLQSLTINGFILMDDLLPFLSRHPHVTMLQLKTVGSEEVDLPSQERSRLTLGSLATLTISFDFIHAFFNYFDTPCLSIIHLHLRSTLSTTTPFDAFNMLSSLEELHSISLHISFNSHAASCIPRWMPLHPPMLHHLTRLHLEFRHSFNDTDTFVSVALLITHEGFDTTMQDRLLRYFVMFPSTERLRISWMSHGSAMLPETRSWPVFIRNACPRLRHLISPWGSWSESTGMMFIPVD